MSERGEGMRVISRRALREFWVIHPMARNPLAAWFRVLETTDFADFNAIKATFRTADYVAPCTVFDIGGNKFRVITVIHYNRKRVYIRHVFTHQEYDRGCAQVRNAKRREQ